MRQFEGGWSWGAVLNLGTASDKPFHSIYEATISTLAFMRISQGDKNGWLFYVVSASNGQLGRNIPVPGLAYECVTDRIHAVVGFPFLTVDYRPIQMFQYEFYYAALTDLETRLSYHPTDHGRLFVGFEWANQSWFRAARPFRNDQFFMYEKRVEGGLGWTPHKRIDLRVSGGYAFDRFFVENTGLSFNGRTRVDLAPGPYVIAQIELKY